MPEAPEITTFADYLRPLLTGHCVSKAAVCGDKSYTLQHSLVGIFKKLFARPRKCTGVYKKGKFMYFAFDGDVYLGAGLGMAGQWNVRYPDGRVVNAIDSRPLDTSRGRDGKYTNIMADPRFDIFRWEVRAAPKGKLIATIIFNDHRHFSTWHLYDGAEIHDRLDELGPDIMGPTVRPGESIVHEADTMRLMKLLDYQAAHNGDVTAMLMGQKAISGIGNHMKAELLYDAHIWPGAKRLNEKQMADLLASAKRIASRFTKDIKAHGIKGIRFFIYGKKEDPQGHPVEAATFDDKRNTYWVPAVQTRAKGAATNAAC